jgi:tetratricopeptide (TPR) repeat protein
MFRELFSFRSHIAALLVLFFFSLVLTQIPLFNYLGYEFSVLIALCWSLVAGLLTISFWKKSGQDQRPGTRWFISRSVVLGLVPLLIPIVVICVNALFVKNCSFLGGSILFLLIVVPAVLFSQALAFLAAVWVRRRKKTVFVFAWTGVLLHVLFVTFTSAQIFAFNPILGYFAGLTYDEALEVADRLLLYRIGTLAGVVLLVMVALYIHRRGQLHEEEPLFSLDWRKGVVLASGAIVLLMFFLSNRIGLSSSESYIEKTLGGLTETEHFVISYPDSLLKGHRLDQVMRLHEFYYMQLSRTLRVRPTRKIHTFLYASAEQKGRLIGAAGTNIAKPWLWQLHINLGDVDASLKHELVHVFAADFGFPLIRIGINSGLIEGLAVAVERVEYEEPVHRLAALAFQNGLAPDVETLFSITGFMKAPAGVSYTAAGSFCRFLIDRYGIRRFKLLYRTGEFTILYGKPLPMLIKEWQQFLASFHFKDGDRAKAEYLFKRRSIFGKECARVIANLNKETRELLAHRLYDEALASADRSLGHTLSVDAAFQKATALLRLGRYNEAVSFAEARLADSTTASSFLTLRVLLGDALWAIDSVESALRIHAEILRSHLSLSWDEALSLRLEILLRPDLARDLKPYFVSLNDDSARIALLERAVAADPGEAVTRFLLARERIGHEKYEEAVQLLDAIPPMKSPILELARQSRLGQLSIALGRYEQAKIYFWQSLNHVYRDSQALELEERLRFCDWMTSTKDTLN